MSPSKEAANRKVIAMEVNVLYDVLKTLQGAEAEKLRNVIKDINDGKVDGETMRRLLLEYEAKLL